MFATCRAKFLRWPIIVHLRHQKNLLDQASHEVNTRLSSGSKLTGIALSKMKILFASVGVLLLSATSVVAQQTGCVCDCVYTRTEKIKNHRYYESSGASCDGIEGRACLGTHRGETFRGTIHNCEGGPRDFSALFTDVMAAEQTSPKELDAALAKQLERKPRGL